MQDKKYENLITKFKKISEKGWIKGVNNFTSAVGNTFEKEIKI